MNVSDAHVPAISFEEQVAINTHYQIIKRAETRVKETIESQFQPFCSPRKLRRKIESNHMLNK